MKTCPKCSQPRPATTEYFNRKSRADDSLRTVCKVCEREYRAANKSHKQAVDRAYRDSHADELRVKKSEYGRVHREQENARYYAWLEINRERWTVYQRAYARRRKAGKRQYDQQYRKLNGKQIVARQRRWYHANLDHARLNARAAASRYMARKRQAPGTYTPDDVLKMYATQNGLCSYCKGVLANQFHVDHVIPLSRGGSNDPSNLALACPSCNVRKAARLPHEWIPTLVPNP